MSKPNAEPSLTDSSPSVTNPQTTRRTHAPPGCLIGKYYAIGALIEMMLWFENWRDVFDGYRGRRPWVPLRLRRGLVIHHSIDDQVMFTFDEVFRDRSYRRGVNESNEGVMVDLGANVGMVTLDWVSRLNRVTIHAYEPYPRTSRPWQQMLQRTIFQSAYESITKP